MSTSNWENMLHHIYIALHSKRLVAPWGSGPITLTSGAGAYNFGAPGADIIAANAQPYDMHFAWIIVSNASANADYEISLLYGPGDIEFAQVSFTRSNAQNQSSSIGITSDEVPGNSRIRAKVRDNLGGNTVNVKIGYHIHPQGL